uniref:substrate-binding domain-containing protein n=1 Tax=Microbacterium sp. TaxID=51671 RepID=UPI0032220CF0
FDDIFGSELIVPALTTVRSQLELAGERASSHLLALLRGDEVSTEEELLPTQLVVRGSTAARP